MEAKALSSKLIRKALRECKLLRTQNDCEKEPLCRLWAEGLASGPSRFDSVEAIKQEGRRQLEAGSSLR
jgi:antitoxin ParD1/3/4